MHLAVDKWLFLLLVEMLDRHLSKLAPVIDSCGSVHSDDIRRPNEILRLREALVLPRDSGRTISSRSGVEWIPIALL
jgi:hypothetical protein